MTATVEPRAAGSLSPTRLNILRGGYLFMAVGLAIVKWPVIVGDVASRPVFEGVVAALLTAMSLLAIVGLRYPVQLLPILLLETLWKLIWLAVVAVPHLIAGDMDVAMTSVFVSVSLVVVILAVTPWDFVWKRYVTADGEPWR